MRIVVSLVAIIVVIVIGVIVIFPITNMVTITGSISDNTSDNIINTVMGIIPLFIVLFVMLGIVGMFGLGDSSDDEADPVEPDDIPEQHDYKKERIWAEELLKRRYARGEISTKEFNERMANL